MCENESCKVLDCSLRHPKKCRFFQDYHYCKFGNFCKFLHKAIDDDKDIEQIQKQLKYVKKELEKKEKEIRKLDENFLEIENNLKKEIRNILEKNETIDKDVTYLKIENENLKAEIKAIIK